MSKKPFKFHVVSADWGAQFPDGDYSIGRGADPRTANDRNLKSGGGQEPEDDGSNHAVLKGNEKPRVKAAE